MACRNTYKAREAAKEIKHLCQDQRNVGELQIMELNLCSFKSIKECSHKLLDEHKQIHLLINNAGVMCCPYERTEDGYEIQFASNYLGHFFLTILLLPRIIESRPARIINLSSVAHKMGKMDFDDLNWENKPYRSLQAYQRSKLCNMLFTKELHKRFKEVNIEGVNVYSVHPGIIATELGRHLDKTYFSGLRWLMRLVVRFFINSPEQGAQTTIYCAIDEATGKESGLYYSDCKPTQPAKNAENANNAKKLWEVSLNMVNLPNYDPFRQ